MLCKWMVYQIVSKTLSIKIWQRCIADTYRILYFLHHSLHTCLFSMNVRKSVSMSLGISHTSLVSLRMHSNVALSGQIGYQCNLLSIVMIFFVWLWFWFLFLWKVDFISFSSGLLANLDLSFILHLI